MFTVSWLGIGPNYGSLQIKGDTSRYSVRWGDGSRETIRTDLDGDGDPYATSGFGHDYAADGTYDVIVKQAGTGSPAVRLKAFVYANATDPVKVAGTRLDDLVVGGLGDDRLGGGLGHDTIDGGDGNDAITGGDDADFLVGGDGNDGIRGDGGNDLVTGDYGNDRLIGGDGLDILFGGDCNDVLSGGDGNDQLVGGAGNDRLYGGAGSDIFLFGREGDARRDPARDTVADFAQGSDKLSVGGWADRPFAFIGTDGFRATGAPEVRAVVSDTYAFVYGDADGNGTVDFSFKVAGALVLAASDFFL